MKLATLSFLAFALAAPFAQADDCIQTLQRAKDAYQAIELSDSCRELVNKPGVPGKLAVLSACGMSTGSKLSAARDIKKSACSQAQCAEQCPAACGDNGLAAFLGNVNGGSCR